MTDPQTHHDLQQRRRARFGLTDSRAKSDVEEWLNDKGSIAAFLTLAAIGVFAIIALIVNLIR